jgi:hypothetical protein
MQQQQVRASLGLGNSLTRPDCAFAVAHHNAHHRMQPVPRKHTTSSVPCNVQFDTQVGGSGKRKKGVNGLVSHLARIKFAAAHSDEEVCLKAIATSPTTVRLLDFDLNASLNQEAAINEITLEDTKNQVLFVKVDNINADMGRVVVNVVQETDRHCR